MLAELIPKLAEFDREERDFRPRPSLAGPERCARQMVYWGLNYPKKPLAGRAIIIFSDSSFHEDLTLDWLRKSAYKVHSEQLVVDCPAPMRTGKIDAIITDIIGKDFLLEHKALNHFTSEAIWRGSQMPLDNLTQMAIYLHGLQEVNPDITEGILLIKNKNTAAYLEFICKYNKKIDTLSILEMTNSIGERKDINKDLPNIVKSACEKFNHILDCIKRKHLPKRDYALEDWQCSYCQFSGTCWEEYEKELESMAKDVTLEGEIADLVGYYAKANLDAKEMTKEADELKSKIKNLMHEKGIQSGRAQEYVVTLKLQKREYLDKGLLTEEERQRCLRIGQSEMLFIRNLKKKGEKI